MQKQKIDRNIALMMGISSLAILLLIPRAVQGETLAAIRNLNSPAFFPILAAGLVLLSSVAIGVQAMTGLPEADTIIELPLSWKRFGLAALLIGSYAVAIALIGMNVATLMLLTLMPWVFDYYNFKLILPVAVGVTAVIYFLFEKVLLILLPRGVLF